MLLKAIVKPFKRPCHSAFQAPPLSRLEMGSLEKIFARLFSSEDGRKALAYLQTITFMQAAAIDSPADNLRYIEGQRALMIKILRLIERGRLNTPLSDNKGDI